MTLSEFIRMIVFFVFFSWILPKLMDRFSSTEERKASKTTMTTPKQPVLVLIPGSYCPAFFYYELRDNLVRAGYEVYLKDLPTTSGAPGLPPASLSDDGAFFHNLIEVLVNEGRKVVVIGHSYGGMVLRESIHSLSIAHRQKHNLPGGITRLVYISPILTLPGENGMQSISNNADVLTFPTANITELVDPDTEGGPQYLRQIPLKAWEFFFGDMTKAEGVKWTARMTMHTMAAWTTPTTVLPEDEKKVPVTFIKCLRDVVFPLEFQMRMVKFLEDEGSQVDVQEIDSAHCPNASCPSDLAALLRSVIEEEGGSLLPRGAAEQHEKKE